jgi:hypothetical protein
MDGSLLTVLVLLAVVFGIVALLVYVNNRDIKRDKKKMNK